jgi:hypothetical protein
MIFLVTGLVLGLYVVGIEFSRDALLVAFTVAMYGEVLTYRLTKGPKTDG